MFIDLPSFGVGVLTGIILVFAIFALLWFVSESVK